MLSLNHPIMQPINIDCAPDLRRLGMGGQGAAEAVSDVWEQLTPC